MLRGLWFFAQLAVLVMAAVFLAEQKGPVSIEWRGSLLETSVGALAAMVVALAVLLVIIWRLWRLVRGTPRAVGRVRTTRRRRRGEAALLRALSAMAAGEPALALRHATDAEAIGDPARAHLAAAEAAEATGDRVRAEAEYARLRDRPDTALVGLRGLIGLAEAEGNIADAAELARRARRVAPRSPWAASRLFAFEGKLGAYDQAERTLADATKLGAFPAADADRMLARLLLARALSADAENRTTEALTHAERAHRLDPGLAAAALLAARLLAQAGRVPAAERVLTESWSAAPDAALAEAWVALAPPGDLTLRVKQAERLHALDRTNVDARFALAEAELAAGRWAEARGHLVPPDAGHPATGRYRWMMAYLESATGNEAAARMWLEKSRFQSETEVDGQGAIAASSAA